MNFFSLNAGHSRIFGLDVLRFFAIIFVVFGHSMILVPNPTVTHTVGQTETIEQISKNYHVSKEKIYEKNNGAKDGIAPGEELKIPKEHWLKTFSNAILLDGVAIFFVLSGFLIGGILVKLLEREKPTFPVLLNFWNRRWLRTLPMYFLILIILVISTYFINPDKLPSDLWKFLFFFQNFTVRPPSFFGESWSLSIEEWFYFLVPLLLFGGLYIFKTKVKTMFLIVIPLVIVSIFGYRYFMFQQVVENKKAFAEMGLDFSPYSARTQITKLIDSQKPTPESEKLRKELEETQGEDNLTSVIMENRAKITELQEAKGPIKRNTQSLKLTNGESHRYLMKVMSRLDSIIYGVLAAFLAFYYPATWKKASNVNLVFIGLVLLYLMKMRMGTEWLVWSPAFKSLAVMIMLPFLSNWKSVRWKISKVVTFISLISYSMYLVNLSLVTHVMIKFGLNNETIDAPHVAGPNWPWEYLLYWVLTIGLSFIFYKTIEIPFMNMRKKER